MLKQIKTKAQRRMEWTLRHQGTSYVPIMKVLERILLTFGEPIKFSMNFIIPERRNHICGGWNSKNN